MEDLNKLIEGIPFDSLDIIEEQINQETIERERELCTNSYFEFVKKACLQLEPETDWSFNWHIKEACDMAQAEIMRIVRGEKKKHDLAINIPPGSMKSKIFSVCLGPWAWIHAPYLKIGGHSFNQHLSTDHCVESRDLIQTPWYQERFGHIFQLKEDENTKTIYSNTRGGERRASVKTGNHFDIIVVDDPLDPKEKSSEVMLKKVLDTFFKIIPSRLKNPKTGVRILVMQRLHELDPCGEILDKKLKYKFLILPAEVSEDVQPKALAKKYKRGLLWPDRFPKSFLQDKKEELGSKEYAGQYMQRPAPEEGDVFKKHWFKYFHERDLPKDLVRNYYTDSAFGVEGGDNSASLCWSVHRGNMYIWAVLTKRLKIPKWKVAYQRFVELTGGDDRSRHFIENKASGHDIEATLREETPFNMIIDTIRNDISKYARAEAASPKVEGGRVFLLEGGSWVDDFIHEVTTYPGSRHDDRVDALSGSIRKTNFKFEPDEDGEEDLTDGW